MSTFRILLAALALAGLWSAPAAVAHAAQSYDNCTGFIETLPTSITSSGTWCLRKDLATAMTDGNAITVAANNVTIDCNDFRIGGLAAGNRSYASGIWAINRQNVTVRHCAVRGFFIGIEIRQGSGHLVEDNRVDNNLVIGISVNAENRAAIIRRNRVIDTGGYPGQPMAIGIASNSDVIDNTIDGVFSAMADSYPIGIDHNGFYAEISNNRVRGIPPVGQGRGIGINSPNAGNAISGNRVLVTGVDGFGIQAHAQSFCAGNLVHGFTTAIGGCQDVGGNAHN